MARLKHAVTGVIVHVADETVPHLGREWGDPDAVERSAAPDKTWKVADLKSFAAEHDPVIDLGDATKKEDVLAAISAALESQGSAGTDGQGN